MKEFLKLFGGITPDELRRVRVSMEKYDKSVYEYQARKKAEFERMKEGEKK